MVKECPPDYKMVHDARRGTLSVVPWSEKHRIAIVCSDIEQRAQWNKCSLRENTKTPGWLYLRATCRRLAIPVSSPATSVIPQQIEGQEKTPKTDVTHIGAAV